MSNQVFISYSRKDTRFVRYLQTKFEKEEFSFWIDKDRLEGGVDWRQEIDKAIRTSFALIVVLSPESAASKYVTYEWSYALGLNILVIPIRIASIDPKDIHPRLENVQYHDFTNQDNEPWAALTKQLHQHKQKYPSIGGSEHAWKYIEEGRNKRNDPYNALGAFEEALKWASPNLKDDIYFEMGKAYLKLKKFDQAETHLLNTLKQNSNHIEALLELGTLYRKKADQLEEPVDEKERKKLLEKAQEKFQSALHLQEDLLDVNKESVWGSLGGIYQRLNDIDKAIECYKKAISIQKTSYPFNNLGLLYLEKEQFEEMRKNSSLVELFAQQRIRLDPADEWAHNDLFVALLINGKLKEAKVTFQHITGLSPERALESLEKTLKRLQNKSSGLKPNIVSYVSKCLLEIEKNIKNGKS